LDNSALVRISPDHDAERLAVEFRQSRRMHIAGFLQEDDAARIHDALVHRTPWNLTVQHNGPKDITPQQWEGLSPEQKSRLGQEVIEGAKRGFQGRYGTLRLSAKGETFEGGIPELAALTAFLNGESFLSFARALTGAPQIAVADAQATLYTSGDFLTEHDDRHEQRKRIAAYVLNFTRHWKTDWGGLLCFPDDAQHTADVYIPAWNALNIFMVPQFHSVSFVTPYATAGRYSVTGWLCAR
jgi:Rps23 Pro-64 3,4-dihydroxylase Tpa1-like proline 4-hydroxylase